MASFLPSHYFSAGKHNILYTATDADGNRAKCGFTITVLPNSGTNSSRNPNPSSQLPAPVSSSRRHNFRNYAVTAEKSIETNSCDKVPNIENGKMECFPYGRDGKRCKPKCNESHQFYQKFQGRPPSYLCIPPNRVDWKIRKFIPDCSPTHEIHLNGRQCEAGWEHRGQSTCVACPPGMYRPQDDPLCQLCPKGLYSDQFGSAKCVRCPMYHTTRGLGSRQSTQCYYHRAAARSSLLVDRKKGRHRGGKASEAAFMYYNRWMTPGKKDNDSIT